jgi:hypothetical protein
MLGFQAVDPAELEHVEGGIVITLPAVIIFILTSGMPPLTAIR